MALDIDDVWADTIPRVLEVIAERGGPKLKSEDITTWGLGDIVGLQSAEIKELFVYVWGNGLWKLIKPCEPDDVEQIDRLSKIADVSVVTSAGASQVEGKLLWIEKQWSDAGKQFKLPVTVVPYGQTKEKLHYEMYIDDRPATIERAIALGKIGIIRDRPANRNCTVGMRVYSLKEAVDKAEQIILRRWDEY